MKTIEFGYETNYDPSSILNDFGNDTHKYKFAIEVEINDWDDSIEDELTDDLVQKAVKLVKQSKSSKIMNEYKSNKDDYDSLDDFLYEEYPNQILWLKYGHTCEEFGGKEEYNDNILLAEIIKEESGIDVKVANCNYKYNRAISVGKIFDIIKPMTFKELYSLWVKECYPDFTTYSIIEQVD